MGSCGGGGCRSECRSEREDESAEKIAPIFLSDAFNRSPVKSDGRRDLCYKCGDVSSVYNNLCGACFRFSLYGKFKAAVTSNAMISPNDKVLVALSGGPASRVALEFVHEMQLKAHKSWEASNDQALPVFCVGAVFVDETEFGNRSEAVEKAVEEMKSSISSLKPPEKRFHVESIESIFSEDSKDGAGLVPLLKTVTDATGKEDLLRHLKMFALQKIALENGYTIIVLGSCTTTLACHVISATVKGQGYSLPADIQYVDARWEIPVVLPLRDCLQEELRFLCRLDGHKTHQIQDQQFKSINDLVSSFIARVQEENPSRSRSILRTADKLRPFHFNKLSRNLPYEMIPSRVRRKLQNAAKTESTLEVLCPICGGPVTESDTGDLKPTTSMSTARHVAFSALCCHSCRTQILPEELSSLEHFFSLLPGSLTKRVENVTSLENHLLRKEIEEFLLSDDDDDDGGT